jgi:DNA-binding response OmpR family regulator
MTTILVIEDNDAIREEMEQILGFEGFTVLAADNGRTGVSLAQAHRPDLILCDIMMPHLDGYGTLTALRGDAATAAIPVVLVSACREEADVQHGLALGANDYLTKPFTVDGLLAAIQEQLASDRAPAPPKGSTPSAG